MTTYIFIGKKGRMYDIDMKLNYNCPDSEKSGSGKGSCGGKFDEISHAKGVLAARDLAGPSMGPNQRQVNDATKTLQKNNLIPSTFEIPKTELNPFTRIYNNRNPVIGDKFIQGDNVATVISLGKTMTGTETFDYEVIGKKGGRIRTAYKKSTGWK